MSMNRPKIEDIQVAMATSVQRHWGLFLAEGIVLTILGLGAIVVPPLATLAVEILIGWLFLVSGVVGLVTTLWLRSAPGFLWSLVSALVGIAAGVSLLFWPVNGIISLTFVLIAFFVIEGVASIMFAFEHRRDQAGRWTWMLASGVIDLILAVAIISGLPGAAAWAIGLLVGINMIMGGVALIGMALHARQQSRG